MLGLAGGKKRFSGHAHAMGTVPDDHEVDRLDTDALNYRLLDTHERALRTDEQVASALGFSPFSLKDTEELFLPREIDIKGYCDVRNHVLTAWQREKWKGKVLTRSECARKISSRSVGLVNYAWAYLTTFGYINLGISEELRQTAGFSPIEPSRGTVVVIGAGLAGLACARHLTALGHPVIVLEGRHRPGGRVHTKVLSGTHEGREVQGAAELGGSVLYGGDYGPLVTLVDQMGGNRQVLNPNTVMYDWQGGKISERIDGEAYGVYNAVEERLEAIGGTDEFQNLEDVSRGMAFEQQWQREFGGRSWDAAKRKPRGNELRDRLVNWQIAHLEFAHAQCVSELSLKHAEQDDNYNLKGDHFLVEGGNKTFVEGLAKDLNILYGHKVTEIEYSAETGVNVTAEVIPEGNDKFEEREVVRFTQAIACVVTVPVGVLKRGVIEFKPPLTKRKQNAIDEIGFGVLNKCILLFPSRFWTEETFGFVNDGDWDEQRGCHFLFHSYEYVAGAPVLLALSSGKAARNFETQTKEEVKEKMMERLRLIYRKKNIVVPEPLAFETTNWGLDPFAYGCYSSLVVGSKGETCDVLREDLCRRVFFAGEATYKEYIATMHGAFLSGLRAAGIIHTLYSGYGEGQKAAVYDDEKRRKVDACFSRPDLEFGCFKVRKGSGKFGDKALVQVRLPAEDNMSGPIHKIVVIPEAIVTELENVDGNKEGIKYLVKTGRLKTKGEDKSHSQTILEFMDSLGDE